MSIDSLFKLLIFAAFLLPGFVIIKVRQYVKEYRNLDNFSATTQSLFFSLVLLGVWASVNLVYEVLLHPGYNFSSAVKRLVVDNDLSLLFNPKAWYGILSFSVTFGLGLVFVFIWDWVSGTHLMVTRLIGFKSKSKNLTPWEDLFFLAFDKYVLVKVRDGYAYVGQLKFASHQPFDRELIIGKHEDYGIEVLGPEGEVRFDHDIDHVYVSAAEIVSILIIDTGVKPGQNGSVRKGVWESLESNLNSLLERHPVSIAILFYAVLAGFAYTFSFDLGCHLSRGVCGHESEILLEIAGIFLVLIMTFRAAREANYKYASEL